MLNPLKVLYLVSEFNNAVSPDRLACWRIDRRLDKIAGRVGGDAVWPFEALDWMALGGASVTSASGGTVTGLPGGRLKRDGVAAWPEPSRPRRCAPAARGLQNF